MNREGIYGVSKDKTSIHDKFFLSTASTIITDITDTDQGLQIKYYSEGPQHAVILTPDLLLPDIPPVI